jgi:hypothetical protein
LESPLLHQVVRASSGGFPGSEIIRHYKILVGSNTVCDGYLAGLSAIFVKTRPRVCGGKIAFPKCAGWAERNPECGGSNQK